jgi:hypothetical protein
MPPEMLARIDARAQSLGLDRTTYLKALAHNDYVRPGPFEIFPLEAKPIDSPSVPGVTQAANGRVRVPDRGQLLRWFALTDTAEHRALVDHLARELMSNKRKGN